MTRPCREDRALVDQVREVGPTEARRLPCENVEVDLRRKGLVFDVHVENGATAANVGAVEDHVTVETSWPKQGRVEDIWPVGGCDDDHMRIRVETVHLDQQLIEGLFPFIVPAAQAGASLSPDRIDLVNEDDAGAGLLGLVEQVAHARCSNADE